MRERLSNVQRGIERRDVEVAELEAEAGQAMAEGLRRGEMAEMPGLEFGPPRDRTPDTGQPNEALRSGALRANEGADFLHERSRAHMERQLRYDDDPNAGLARFTVALADRHYFRAFAKWFNNPFTGGHEWTPKEREAVQRVRTVERSLTLATSGTSGGFLVPYELDPSIILTGQYIDPMREICRVETTAYNVKKFVSSTGSTSSWDTEETEVSDDSPTLSQPSITCKNAATFVPVSIEL